jgi:hypothetical protein
MPSGDYARFLAETLRLARGEKGLLKEAAARKLFTYPYPEGPMSLSGWGDAAKKRKVKGRVLGHDGSNTMNYCTAEVYPDEGLAVFVFTNQGGDPGQTACHQAKAAILKAVRAEK